MVIARRSRTSRTPTGRTIALTARDFAIFEYLSTYRYLRSTYLHALVGGKSETRFKERLGDLFHEGFVDRPENQWEYADARHAPAVHERSKRGATELAAREPLFTRTYLGSNAHRQFAHSLAICAAIASIELACRDCPHLRFIPWGEILSRSPPETRLAPVPFRSSIDEGTSVVPDGIFGLEYRGDQKSGYRFFALEIDRGTMPITRSVTGQTSLAGKFAAYGTLLQRGVPKTVLGVSKLFVLTVTNSERRLAEMVRAAEGVGNDHAPFFLFKAVEEACWKAPVPDLLAGPWQRPAHPPLELS